MNDRHLGTTEFCEYFHFNKTTSTAIVMYMSSKLQGNEVHFTEMDIPG